MMGTQKVQMKGVLPWLVRWVCYAGIRNVCSALAALFGPVQIYQIYSLLARLVAPSICHPKNLPKVLLNV
jgi:hypothetical protein